MRSRHPLPRLWMLTDERQGDALIPAVRRLPRGAGIVFRHYSLPHADRRKLFGRIRRLARARDLFLSLAGPETLALRWRADAFHGREGRRRQLLRTMSAHSLREMREAERSGADLLFLSPVFATQSHPGARTFGATRFNLLLAATQVPVVALGGVDRRKAEALRGYGWAAIDALS